MITSAAELEGVRHRRHHRGLDAAEVTLIEDAIEDIGDMEEIAGQSPVIRLVNYIIFNAVKEGASDIHIEPAERCVRDPLPHRRPACTSRWKCRSTCWRAVTSRIKIMASLDISERRLPQDGRVHVLLDGRKIDLRVSTFPDHRGEKTVIRVLDTRSVSLNLEDLGFARRHALAAFRRNIQAPNGIVLVTGPTGSGKSTTLYAALNAISSMENNICTVEDPIEYHLPLINQFQVQERDRADVLQGPAHAAAARPRRDHGRRESATRKPPAPRFRPR